METHWSRRQVLKSFARLATGTALAGLSRRGALGSQLPPAEPLQDDRVTFVTTTEAKAWQPGAMFKPTFGWETLNLNVDPAQALTAGRPIEGFGGCFNELGWTSLQSASRTEKRAAPALPSHVGARFAYCRMPIGANDSRLKPTATTKPAATSN